MIRITLIPKHRNIAQADAVKRLWTPDELRSHALAIDAILKRIGVKK